MNKEQLDAFRGHTPGPWRRGEDNKWAIIDDKDMTVICRMQPWDESGGRIDDNADAHLIAAAPDLLAHIDEQQAEIDRLREALQWYNKTVGDVKKCTHEGVIAVNALMEDGGAIAIAALKGSE